MLAWSLTAASIYLVVLSLAVFLLFKELMREHRLKRVGSAVVEFLVPLSFGVYLIHLLAVDLIYRAISWSPAASVLVLVAAYLAALAVSVVLTFAISRIKFLGYAFTGQRYKSSRKERLPRPVS